MSQTFVHMFAKYSSILKFFHRRFLQKKFNKTWTKVWRNVLTHIANRRSLHFRNGHSLLFANLLRQTAKARNL